jgi:hypothetical protein
VDDSDSHVICAGWVDWVSDNRDWYLKGTGPKKDGADRMNDVMYEKKCA